MFSPGLLAFVSVWHQEIGELTTLIDHPALRMHQILSSTVAQCTAGLSPLIGPAVRLLITSEKDVSLNATQTQKSVKGRCSKVKLSFFGLKQQCFSKMQFFLTLCKT